MMVTLVNNKAVIQGSSHSGKQARADELLMFAVQAISSLLKKTLAYDSLDPSFLDKIFQMLLLLPSKAVRVKLCEGLQSAFAERS